MRRASSSPTTLRVRPGLITVVVAALGLGIGVLATIGLWTGLDARMVAGNIPDALHYSWWLGHTPHALGQGSSPFATLDLNWPEGVSAMNNTTLLLPAVLLWPVTALFSSLFTLNLLNVLAVPACAAAGYWALRQIPLEPARLSRPAALVGATAFAISPAIVNSLVGHITMAFAPALPVLVILSVAAWHGERPVRTGLLLGVVATAQVFTGEEVLFQAGVGALLILIVAALSCPRAVPRAAKRLAKALAAAFAVFLPIAGYPLYLQFFGPRRQQGSPFLLDYFGADLTSFTTATGQVLLHTQASAEAAARFPGGVEEHLGYLGWPLLITCLVTAVLGWRRLPVRCAAIALVASMALSLGGRLWIDGTWTQRPGPYRLLQALPITEASLATRFGLLAALFAGALLAFAVHRLAAGTARPWPGAVLAAGLAVACLAPLLPAPLEVVDAPLVPTYFTGAAKALPADAVLLVLPYPVANKPVAMRWQSAAGYHFRMPGGYFLGPAGDGQAYVGGAADPPTAQLLAKVAETGEQILVTTQQRRQAAEDFARWQPSGIVLGPDPAAAALAATISDLLGRQPVRVAGVDLWAGTPVVP